MFSKPASAACSSGRYVWVRAGRELSARVMPTLAAGPVHLVGLPAPPVAMRTIRLFSTGDNDASPKPAADPTPAVKPQANLETEKETLGERFERLGDSIKARFLPKKQVTRIFGKMEYVEPIDGYVFYQADEKALAKFRNSMIFPSSMMATTLVMLSTVNWPTEALAIWLLAFASSGMAMWQRSLQVTRVSAVAMPESKDSRTFPRLNRQAVEMGAAAPTQTAGVGAAEGTAVQCPVVTEYVIERYGYPFSQFKRVRVAASTSECFSRVKDGTFTPKFMVPADIKRAQNSPIWERVNLRHTSSGQPVTLFLDQVRDCTVMNQLLASSATPDNSEDDTAKFVAAFYPSFDARYYKTPVDEKGNMLVSKGDERERLAVNPLLHSSYNSDTGLFRPHPETKAERELERLDELRRMKAHADAHMPETFAGTGPLERRVNAGDNVDIHAAFRRARAHAAAARQGPQEAAPLAQSKPAAAQALPEGLGGSTSRSAAAGKGFTPRAKGNEPTDNQQQASAGTGATAAKGPNPSAGAA